MDNFLAIPEEDRVDIFSITFEKFEKGLAKAMDRAKMSFFEVGYWLYQAHNSTDFIYNNGYENIADYAYQKFGLTKSTTYDLMKVYHRFRDPSGYALAPEYINLSQSKLVALSRMKYTEKYFLSKVKPTDTVSDVEKAVKIYNYNISHGGSNGSFSDIKEYIKKYEPVIEKEKAEVAENSRRLEKIQAENIISAIMVTKRSYAAVMKLIQNENVWTSEIRKIYLQIENGFTKLEQAIQNEVKEETS